MTDGNEIDEAKIERELIEFLNELRVLVPGVQTLYAFMIAVPFTQQFQIVSGVERGVFLAGFLSATVSVVLLSAPSLYHRLHWRRDVREKDRMLRMFNKLAVGGGSFLAIAMSCTVFVVCDVLFHRLASEVITGSVVLLFAWLWYVLPISRRLRGR